MVHRFKFSDVPASPETEGAPSGRGIVQCLRMLADEAAALGLGDTLAALRTAIMVCVGEHDTAETDGGADAAAAHNTLCRPPGTGLH
jgi:hypothetical protein